MFQHLLQQIALGLDARGIRYMIIGGQAVLLYGEPRLTRDIDVAVGVGPDRLADLLSLVTENHWQVLVENSAEFVQKTLVLPCLDPASGIRLDFIFSQSAYEKQAMERVQGVLQGSAVVGFASVEDVIIHKIVAGRPRDLEDVRSIIAKHPVLDLAYVRRWLQELDRGLGEKFPARFEAMWTAARQQDA